MRYEMRRKDREIPREEALAVLDGAPYGVMAAVDSGGEPYCVPLSFVRDGEWLYFHGAHEGHKIDAIKARPGVCISFTGPNLEFPKDDFTVVFESATVFGAAEEVRDDEEKIRSLRLLCERFSPENMAAFDGYVAKLLTATAVWRIHIDSISGKRRKHGA
jgi:nitroimidazol reductase NimA-like FMN-containing flavoprotein (pyridoxamine 5'-phosphate oxidase superfamily)